MTKREAAIISAYTDYLLGDFNDLHAYIEEVMDRPVFTHEMGDKTFTDELHDKCKPDFMNLKLEDSEPMFHSGLSVAKAKKDYDGNYNYESLYENISNPDDALLLSQLAMSDKNDTDLIIIFPGWNYCLEKHDILYKKALELAAKYRYEKKED